ncbi:mannose-1-phosphate guanylyltransferase, partial [Candidatus Gracilibacteria bacterium CG17_big_fil_post_rev_8_21_14_2_50_48_13]
IGLALIHLLKEMKDPEEPVVILPSDHLFGHPERFLTYLQRAETFAKSSASHVVTLGVRPTYPATTYGYIKMSEELTDNVFQVERFVEKPDLERAQSYSESWEYLWNLGIFVVRPAVLLELFQTHLPSTFAALQELQGALGTDRYEEILPAAFRSMDKISIDFGILEKTPHIAVVPADGLGWTDVGNWRELKAARSDSDEKGNVTQGQVVTVDTKNSLIFSQGKKTVAVLGLENMIVVDTEDALLVMPAERAPEIKLLVDEIKAEKLNDYL